MSESTTETRMQTIRLDLHNLIVRMKRESLTLIDCRRIVEREIVATALSDAKQNQCKAALYLGLHRNSLNRRMKMLGLESKKRLASGKIVERQPSHIITVVSSPVEDIRRRRELEELERELYPNLSVIENERRRKMVKDRV